MVVTVVLRLLPGPLDSGELIGHAEDVATGDVIPVRGPSDVVELALAVRRRTADSAPGANSSPDGNDPANG